MMLWKCLPGIAACVSLSIPAAAQTVDQILAKHVKARGGLDKIKGIQSARMQGTMTMGTGVEFPLVVEFKRPHKFRFEFTFQGMTGVVQAYDGSTAWMHMPFMGKADPAPLSAEEAKEAVENSDFEGALVDSKAKGHSVELVGKEKIEGTDAYKLKVTLRTGAVRYDFIDAESFLEIRRDGKRNVQGTATEFESTIGDYREVGGVMFAHSVQNLAKAAAIQQKLVFNSIELNVPLEDARFTLPAADAPQPASRPEAKKPEAKPQR